MNLKLFYSPPWKAFEAPEKPRTPFLDEDTGRSRKFNNYEKAYAEAKANALEVGNPERCSLAYDGKVYFFTCKFIGFADKVEPNRDYDWPGSAVIKDGKYILEIYEK